MIKFLLTYLLGLLFTFSAMASEPTVDIRYDGIYLNHPTLSQIEKLYNDYKYKDYIYMPDWKYPPIFLDSLPIDYNQITDSQKRNKLFLQILAPLALKLNLEISLEKWDIEKIIEEYNKNLNLTDEQIKFIEQKAEKYDIFTRLKGEKRYAYILKELKLKVDNIPPSILMAIAAVETNWGTSRPAQLANSLYRELVWYTNEGLEPLDDTEDKTYRYKIFPTLYDSMVSHALKINSNVNYGQFRTERKQVRYREKPLIGRNIVHTMMLDSNLQNFAGLLDYTMTFYELSNIDEAELAPLDLPE